MQKRTTAAVLMMALLLAGHASAQRTAIPLNDHTRLGQRFTVSRPMDRLWVTVPSWSDNEGGLTLSLWDSPARKHLIARQHYDDVRDNARVELRLKRPVPAGTYYWEVSERTGTTRIGLYADPVPEATDDCAYLDGLPNRTMLFVYGVGIPEVIVRSSHELTAIVRSAQATPIEKAEACRELAVVGDRQAVDALAAMLGDANLAHMARHALEPMPFASVDAALRKAMERLRGPLLVGVINSAGVRRDAKAVPQLRSLLENPDAEVEAAAAAALGRVGNEAAADALQANLAASGGRPIVAEACLECARQLASEGRTGRAVALYEALEASEAPEHLRAAAFQGRLMARGPAASAELNRAIADGSLRIMRAGLWVVSHGMTGSPEVTTALAEQLSRLPEDRAVLLAAALGDRRDAAAIPALRSAVETGSGGLKKAACEALARMGGPAAVGALVALVQSASPDVSSIAGAALAGLPLMEAESAASALMSQADDASRLAGVEIAAAKGIVRLKPRLVELARTGDAPLRRASLKALQGLVSANDLEALLALLPQCTGADDLGALEGALTAASSRSSDPEKTAAVLSDAFARAGAAHRVLLLRVLAAAGGVKALEVVRESLGSAEPDLRQTALDLLCDWTTPDAAPLLIQQARQTSDMAARTRCIRGALRIAASPDVDANRRLAICRDVMPLVTRDDERRALLGAVGGIASLEALDTAAGFLETPAVLPEACEAVLSIAEKLPPQQRSDPRTVAALRRLADVAPDAAAKERAQRLLNAPPVSGG